MRSGDGALMAQRKLFRWRKKSIEEKPAMRVCITSFFSWVESRYSIAGESSMQ
jgi:hypothetical protein